MKQPSVAWPQLEFLIVLSFECAVPEPLCTFTGPEPRQFTAFLLSILISEVSDQTLKHVGRPD
jgi:hypothetical protein